MCDRFGLSPVDPFIRATYAPLVGVSTHGADAWMRFAAEALYCLDRATKGCVLETNMMLALLPQRLRVILVLSPDLSPECTEAMSTYIATVKSLSVYTDRPACVDALIACVRAYRAACLSDP